MASAIEMRRMTMMAWRGNKLPSQFQQIDYIQSTGTQYINTGIYPKTETIAKARYKLVARSASPFAARWSGAETYDTFGIYCNTLTTSVFYFGRYSNTEYITLPTTLNQIIDITIGIDNIIIDNHDYGITRSALQSTQPIYLFCMNNMGVAEFPSRAAMYSFVIIENENVLMNMIPCVRKLDSKPGMYDTVTKTFFTNAGTGEFIIPD